jgi:hypothetical protein
MSLKDRSQKSESFLHPLYYTHFLAVPFSLSFFSLDLFLSLNILYYLVYA